MWNNWNFKDLSEPGQLPKFLSNNPTQGDSSRNLRTQHKEIHPEISEPNTRRFIQRSQYSSTPTQGDSFRNLINPNTRRFIQKSRQPQYKAIHSSISELQILVSSPPTTGGVVDREHQFKGFFTFALPQHQDLLRSQKCKFEIFELSSKVFGYQFWG